MYGASCNAELAFLHLYLCVLSSRSLRLLLREEDYISGARVSWLPDHSWENAEPHFSPHPAALMSRLSITTTLIQLWEELVQTLRLVSRRLHHAASTHCSESPSLTAPHSCKYCLFCCCLFNSVGFVKQPSATGDSGCLSIMILRRRSNFLTVGYTLCLSVLKVLIRFFSSLAAGGPLSSRVTVTL